MVQSTSEAPILAAEIPSETDPGKPPKTQVDFVQVDEDDGLELQVALDSLASGNSEPMKRHLARIQGLDPEKFSLRSSPWTPIPGSEIRFLGESDFIGDPEQKASDDGNNIRLDREVRAPRAILDDPEQLYMYEPLLSNPEQMRLLRHGPADDQGIIHTLELHTFDLETLPRFYALSYVWGQPDKIVPLTCNGGRVMITRNLAAALNESFVKFPNMWLWADGICINQDDLLERSQQVRMMGQIYGSAALVIAHMGNYSIEGRNNNPKHMLDPAADMSENDISTILANSKLEDSPKSDDGKLLAHPETEGNNSSDPMGPVPPFQSALSLMNYLSRIWLFDDDYTLKGDEFWEKKKLGDYENIWIQLFAFWEEDWFFRSWVLQEAVLGKKVILLVQGVACSLDFVMKFWERAKKRDTPEILKRGPLADEYARILHLSPVSAINALRDIKHRKPEQPAGVGGSAAADSHDQAPGEQPKADILNLLVLSRVNLATDPRDKIYSLLGLAERDSLANSIIPDYSESNTIASLYRNIATSLIQTGRGPELLQYAGIDQKVPNLPSWAPDWSHQSRSAMKSHLYNCSGSSRPCLSISDIEPQKLRIRGAAIDTIKQYGMAWRYYSIDRNPDKFAPFKEAPNQVFPHFSDEDSRCLIRTVAKKFNPFCTKFDPAEGRDTAMAKTLVMDTTWRGKRTASDPSFLESFKAFEKLYGAGREPSTPSNVKIHISGIFHWVWDFDEEEESRLRTQSWPFELALQEAHKGRRFCATAEGYMCTAPYDTEKGDVVVVFEGFKTPFVLRKEGLEWRLVGDCYVHGIMDGELVVLLAGEDVEPDKISVNVDGEAFGLRTEKGLATFEEFVLI